MPEKITMEALKARHTKAVERRAKYLATMTPKQRQIRDDYVAWVRWWKFEYKKLAKTIHNAKRFVRSEGHNNLETLKLAMRGLEKQRLRARTMLMAREYAKVDYQCKMEDEVPPKTEPLVM
jgi:hypothetical protein